MSQPFVSRRLPGALVLLCLLAFAVASEAADVYVDYNREYDWEGVESFAWKETPDTSVDRFAHSWIVNAIEHYLGDLGLIEETESPDIWVTYHGSTSGEVVLDTTTWGYRINPAGMYWDPYWGTTYVYDQSSVDRAQSTTQSIRRYSSGTLVIDAIDAKSSELVWRGSATGTIAERGAERRKELSRAIDKIVKKFRKLRKKDMRKR